MQVQVQMRRRLHGAVASLASTQRMESGKRQRNDMSLGGIITLPGEPAAFGSRISPCSASFYGRTAPLPTLLCSLNIAALVLIARYIPIR